MIHGKDPAVYKHHATYALATAIMTLGHDKLAVALAVIVGVTVLAFTGKMESAEVIGLYSAVIGYVLGRTGAVPQRAEDASTKDGETTP